MTKELLTFILLSILFQKGFSQDYPKDYFRSPLDIPLVLSGTFAELRGNHFHGGIDIKTQGVEGKSVYAVADGYVSRIKISPWGYGNALYITHPNGYTSVYGHLQNFSTVIADYAKSQQYKRKSFDVDLYLNASTIKVKKGDVVAASGNTGGSGGPHLHFEIRNGNQEPINPLLFGFDVKDSRKPQIFGLYEYHLDPANPERKELERIQRPIKALGNGLYQIDNYSTSGKVAFGIHTIDQLDGASNKNGPYSIRTYVNDTLVHEFRAEKFNFNESRYLNAHIDYGMSKSLKRSINRCYVLPGNYLKMYPSKGESVLTLEDGKTYNMKWIVEDAKGNESILTTSITGTSKEWTSSDNQNWVDFKDDYYLKTDDFGFTIPKGSLYQSEIIEYKKEASSNPLFIGDIHKIGTYEIPLHKYVYAKIKVPDSCDIPSDKLLVSYLQNDKNPSNEGGDYSDGWISFKTRNLGSFVLMADTIAPIIKRSAAKSIYKTNDLIQFIVTDDLSGIDQYEAKINGNWVLLEYEPKKALFYYKVDERTKSGNNSFEIIIKDERKNSSVLTFDFTMQ